MLAPMGFAPCVAGRLRPLASRRCPGRRSALKTRPKVKPRSDQEGDEELSKQRSYLLYIVLLVSGAVTIGLDQWSKAAIRQHFGACPSPTDAYIPLAGKYFGLIYLCNTGSAFSFFEHGQQALLFVFIAAALATLIWLYLRYG